MTQPRTIELMFFDAGGGHRSAAMALSQVMAERYPHWRVSLVNLQDVLQEADFFHHITKINAQDIYNMIMKRGWTHGAHGFLRVLQFIIRCMAPIMRKVLARHWQSTRPDLVVSLVPNFNAVMFQALRKVSVHTPYVTVMTDLADYPPHFWQEKQDQYMICGSDKAMHQGAMMGYAADHLFRVSGMVLKPHFYKQSEVATITHESLGLSPHIPTALIMFGGYSSDRVEKIVAALQVASTPVQCIVMCGHNEKLRDRLKVYKGCHAVGFTMDVPAYMRLADFFIGKPGPGSLSEALMMGLPVIVERNDATLPQERYNTQWVEEQDVGIVLKDFEQDIAAAVHDLLQSNRLAQFRHNTRQIDNQAVFEIPEIFARIFQAHAYDDIVADSIC